jgi:hypothetical protein
MTETTQNTNNIPNELTLLKQRADLMGIKYHPNIGIDALRDKVNTLLATAEPSELSTVPVTENPDAITSGNPVIKLPESFTEAELSTLPIYTVDPNETDSQRMSRERKELHSLVRVQITCMNPDKKDWKGEIITVGNSTMGDITKFIPYNVSDEHGYHIPKLFLSVLQERKYTQHYTEKTSDGRKVNKQKQAAEFSVMILPPLSPDDLQALKNQQAISRSLED